MSRRHVSLATHQRERESLESLRKRLCNEIHTHDHDSPSLNRRNSRYSRNCKFYGSARGCSYGENCSDSHRHPNSVPLCTNYKPCCYGDRCQFRHKVFPRNHRQRTMFDSPNHRSHNSDQKDLELRQSSNPNEINMSLVDALCYCDSIRPTINASKNILPYYDAHFQGPHIKDATYYDNIKAKEIEYKYHINHKSFFGKISYSNGTQKYAQRIATVHLITDLYKHFFKINFRNIRFKFVRDEQRRDLYKLMNANNMYSNVNCVNKQRLALQFVNEYNVLHCVYDSILKQIFYPICDSIVHKYIDKKKTVNLTLIDALMKHSKSAIKRVENILKFYGMKLNSNYSQIQNAIYRLNTPKTKMITYIFENEFEGFDVKEIKINKTKSFENVSSLHWQARAISYATIKIISKIFYDLFQIDLSKFEFVLRKNENDYKFRYKCETLRCNENNGIQIRINGVSNEISAVAYDGYLEMKEVTKEIVAQFFFKLCDLVQTHFNMNDKSARKRKSNHNKKRKKKGAKRRMIDLTGDDNESENEWANVYGAHNRKRQRIKQENDENTINLIPDFGD